MVRQRLGSIPAWAGEPGTRSGPKRASTVYPRVGGGTTYQGGADDHVQGLSPRGRGNRQTACTRFRRNRSIPAWAGEPLVLYYRTDMKQVYPRVGGGTMNSWANSHCLWGLSPRGRGNRVDRYGPVLASGSIPAWAGEPPQPGAIVHSEWVYPRVGGGTASTRAALAQDVGLSPRGRGNLALTLKDTEVDGSIPAWAGEPRRPRGTRTGTPVYPRVGGGTEKGENARCVLKGSIPAWAGEPPSA